MNSTTSTDHISVAYELAPDLSGRVSKEEDYYFDHGGSADIWKGKWQKTSESSQLVALKVMKGLDDDPVMHKRLRRETRVWSTISHTNIAPLFGISFDFVRPGVPCLVSSYYRNGNLRKYLARYKDVRRGPLFHQIALALSHLHSLSVIHGDIKAANILINDEGQACLTDFGLSRILQTTGFTTKTPTGTPRFMAPELHVNGEGDEEALPRTTKASDVWAYAMTVLEILTNAVPFYYIHWDAKVQLMVQRGHRPSREHSAQINDDTWSFLEECWQFDPAERPSMNTVASFFGAQASLVVEECKPSDSPSVV